MNRLPLMSKKASPAGFSLIEVILATAILMGSVVVLARLAGMGRWQAAKAALHTQAQQLCENTMNELLLGLRPLVATEAEPLLPAEAELGLELEETTSLEQTLGETGFPVEETDRLYGETNSEGEADWLYSVRINPVELNLSSADQQDANLTSSTDSSNLQMLSVEVVQADENLLRPVRFSLTRWVRIRGMNSQTDENSSFDFDSEGGF